MNSKHLYLVAVFALSTELFGANVGLNTPPCQPNTLKFYMDNYGSGPEAASCAIGDLVYNEFFFKSLPVRGNSSNAAFGGILAEDIWILPDASRSAFDYFPIAGKPNLFNRTVNPGEAERYFFSYKADPPPIIAGDELFLDPPTGPVYGTKWICTDRDFATSTLGGLSFTNYAATLNRLNYGAGTFECSAGNGVPQGPAYIIKTDGDPTTPDVSVQDKVIFDMPASVINVILLLDFEAGNNATGRTVTGFEGVQTPVILTTIPEPGNMLLMGSSLIAILTMMRRTKR